MSNIVAIDKNKTNVQTCASALVDALTEVGVDSIFGYPGASVLSIYNELSKTKEINHYLVRHEQAAVHSAEGYARISGKAGVVLVTSGPGFTNTITGIANAYADSTPLVVLAGDVSALSKNGKIFQNVDIKGMTESCTKRTFVLKSSDDIKKVIKEAFEEANSGIKGPVVVVLPRNLLEMKYTQNSEKYVQPVIKQNDYSEEISKFNKLLKASEKPILLVGGGCSNAFDEIKKFVLKTKIPVVSTLMGIGNFPSQDELYLGMIGINGVYPANTALNRSDLIISLGVSFSDRSTCKNIDFASKTKIISVNLNHISSSFELEISADIKEFLEQLFKCDVEFQSDEKWLKHIKDLKEEAKIDSEDSCLHSSFVLKTISEFTKNLEPVVVTDVGQHQMLTAQYFNFNKPHKFITSGGMGTMGFGLPASMGAYLADNKTLVLNITGDGSFQMNLQELATCREHNIPIKIIIMNNGYLGMVRQLQEKIYKNRYQVEMTNPDFVKIAEAYDLFAIRVTNKRELPEALEKAINHNGTAIIDIMIDGFEEI